MLKPNAADQPLENKRPPHRIHLNAALLMLAGLVLFMLVALSSFQTMRAMERATNLRAQAREGLLLSSSVLSSLKDVETGQRGFILTGDPAYLVPYEAGLSQSATALGRLKRHTTPNLSALSGSLSDLERLMTLRLDMARRNVLARQQEGFDSAQKLILGDEGRLLMDTLRERFAELDRVLRLEIDGRNRQVDRLMRRAFWTEGLLTVLGIVLLVGGYYMLLREQRRRIHAEHALQGAVEHLEGAVKQRTAELEQAKHEIEAFALRLDRGIEAERRRLAREVHDQLGQVFTALKMLLNHGFIRTPEMADRFERMNALLVEGIATARRIAGELQPPLLDDLGLGPALVHKAQRFSQETGMACEATVQHGERLQAEQATQLYRIVQEALTNVVRHAGASRVWIEGLAEDGQFWLTIEDNGRGMEANPTASLGLLSMRERAALAGGKLELGPGHAGGLRVRVGLPLNPLGEIDAHSDR